MLQHKAFKINIIHTWPLRGQLEGAHSLQNVFTFHYQHIHVGVRLPGLLWQVW